MRRGEEDKTNREGGREMRGGEGRRGDGEMGDEFDTFLWNTGLV